MGRRKNPAGVLLDLMGSVRVESDPDLGGAVLVCRVSSWCAWYAPATTVDCVLATAAEHVRDCHGWCARH